MASAAAPNASAASAIRLLFIPVLPGFPALLNCAGLSLTLTCLQTVTSGIRAGKRDSRPHTSGVDEIMPNLVAELDTPAVVIDLDIVEANIRCAQDTLAGHGLANRPPIKTHKIPALAKKQIKPGAIGVTC